MSKSTNVEGGLKCPICKSKKIYKVINWKEYVINNCSNCRLIFSSPQPEDDVLSEFYQGFLYNMLGKNEINGQVKKKKKELMMMFDFKHEIQDQNFLDFGGGTGSAYKAACELGLNVYYHDLDEEAEKYVKTLYGLKDGFVVKSLNETNVRFNYIFSDNVMEHVKDPVGYVVEMKNVLCDGGEILIKTPHGGNTEFFFNPLITVKGYFNRALKYNSLQDSIKSYLFRFWHCDPPRHLFSFSKTNLKLVALNAGFDESEIEISYYRVPLFKYSLAEIFINFRERHSFKSMIFRILLLPILPIELFSKVIQFVLLKMNVLSPGGIILRLRKTDNP